MTDPISFEGSTPRFALPMLFAGQAQKEFFVNEAHALIDALLHCAVELATDAPPATPADGQSWLIGSAPIGDWAGKAGMIASRQSGNWLFTAPRDGMRIFDRALGAERLYLGGWQTPARPAAPGGGTTVDAEARVAIMQLIETLVTSGILPAI